MSGEFLETSRPALAWVLRTTWEASAIAVLVMLAQWLLRGRVSARWRYNLWLLVVARLLLPAVPGTQYSPFNLVQRPPPAPPVSPSPAAVPEPVAVPPAPALARPRLAPPVRVSPVPGRNAEPRPQQQDIHFAADGDARLSSESLGAGDAPARAVRPDTDALRAAFPPPPARPGGDPAAPDGTAPAVAPPPQPATARRPGHAADPTPAPAATPAAPELPRHRRADWLALAAVAWLAGAAVAAARLAWVTLRLSAAVRGLRPVRDPALAHLLAECAASLRLRRLPALLEAHDAFGPALIGLLRPRVVLPACVLRGSFDRDELRLILMHELAHMKRWDVAANWLLAALGVLHWFNPLLAFAFRRMRLDRELACDELVLSAAAPAAARAYGPTILKLLQTLSRGSSLPGMVGVLEGRTNIRRRIAMIARFDRTHRNASPLFGAALTALACGVALTGAATAQHTPPPLDEIDVRPLTVEPAPAGRATEAAAAVPPGVTEPAQLPIAGAPQALPAASAEGATLPAAPADAPAPAGSTPAAVPPAPAAGSAPVKGEGAAAPTAAPAAGAPGLAPPAAAGARRAAPAAAAGGTARGYGVYAGYGGYGAGYGAPAAPPPGYGGYPRPAAPAGRPGAPGMYPGMGVAGAMPAAPGTPGTAADGHVEDPTARGANARAAEALRNPLPVNFDNVPLDDALRFIADATNVDVITDWKSLESAGVSREATVGLTLKQGAPAEQVLHWVLRAAAGDAVGYALDHGVVVVAAQDRIDRMVITRAYKNLGGNNGPALEHLVRDTVAPHTWRENGGAGSVRYFNNQLIVTATEPNHRQVERLLGLMEAHDAPAPADAPGGMVPGDYPGMPGAVMPVR